ncbi:MAG: hypothetical protein ACR2PH_18505 [Desulfobulbia bacterium]
MPNEKNGYPRKFTGASLTKVIPGKPFITKSHIPGIPHQIEGAPSIPDQTVGLSMQERNAAGIYSERPGDNMNRSKAVQESAQAVKAAQQETGRFTALQAARARIKPLEDPEAQKATRRKEAARRKLRGRLGTILSDNAETLG